VQEITREDCIREGFDPHGNDPPLSFAELWDALNAKCGFSWASNPFVWVVSFRRLANEARVYGKGM
jgi:hypothetical protein